MSDTVEARDLRTIYGDTVWNLRVEPGERLLVRGPSGSGKTTMLETIAGLVPAASGEATAPARTRFYAEDAWVFSTSVRENLRVGTPELDDTLATRVLSAVGFPFDLDFVLDNGADSLSAGQRRRLLLARALCSDADVLLLDEPTAHLTPDDSADLMHMLLNSPLPAPKPQRTVIVVTDEN
ncbi:ATP-binding cassette domain-containing protein [Corynebacterium amycolatum]|uniref:ATP-binding cassette domain-containing protein n=1 Tax=Corynebacterium amycolatum TaxID=43765 RepID=UPI001CCCF929|nr:ATP-binding cassette domain-containing protein [Corynebacterium amycolatum]MCA0442724.1 ATP-binding cassette domain-containing protein [Corynebacterium amycolatum]